MVGLFDSSDFYKGKTFHLVFYMLQNYFCDDYSLDSIKCDLILISGYL
jgi:hypothetical protein